MSGQGWNGTTCVECPIGSVNNTGTNTDITGCYCPIGFQWSTSMTACITCPTGTSTTNTGSLAATGCFCISGYTWNGTTCI